MTVRLRLSLGLLIWTAAAIGAAAGAEPAGSSLWQSTLDRVNPAVVVLRVSVPRPFDTESPADELATGFVVDAKRGLILTNRHVVNPGPATIEAVFLDHEEVRTEVVYFDPVHDFGILHYDPDDVEFMKPGELSLVPEHARVGTEIRVVGNDAGEKLSILAGTLARLDRAAPNYGSSRYNDFNIFYYQAASATSGGSSGSPVVDIHGHAVALNAGGHRSASSSFYLPLEPVVRALGLIRRGESVMRGTLQTVFLYRPYDELRRLGLRPETEAMARRLEPDRTGMLVVQEILRDGPADGRLEVGDVLVRAGGQLIATFGPLAALLDGSVGEEVELEVERGGLPLVVALVVQDLHEVTPSEYLELGGAVAHDLSYQQARNHSVPVAGVHLASSGYVFSRAGVPRDVLITDVGGEPVADLDAFEERMASYAHGSLVPVRYFPLDTPNTHSVAVIRVDRHWFEMKRCHRDLEAGGWPCRSAAPPPDPPSPVAATTSFSGDLSRPARDLAPSLVMVDVDLPFRLDGVHGDRFRGTGLVVDAERGLVVVDRETAPITLGDVMITFAESLQIKGEVVYVHPAHNLALVQYDPALIGDTPVRSAELRTGDLVPGDVVWLVGLISGQRVIARETRVSHVEPARITPSPIPRFRETNIELIGLSDTAPTLGGVLTDKKGRVWALWAAFAVDDGNAATTLFAGIPSRAIEEMLEIARSGGKRQWRSLGVELFPISLAQARNRGLSGASARVIEADEHRRRRVFSVVRLTAGTPAADALEVGDLVLAIDGKPARSFAAVEQAARRASVRVSALRDGEERQIDVATVVQDGRGTDRFLLWEGAVLQSPHPAIAAQEGVEVEGVYVSWFWYGSPASRSGLSATRRLVELDGSPTPDLDAFLAVVASRPAGRPARLKTIDLDGKVSVVTLKPDQQFWPTAEIRLGARGWERIDRTARGVSSHAVREPGP